MAYPKVVIELDLRGACTVLVNMKDQAKKAREFLEDVRAKFPEMLAFHESYADQCDEIVEATKASIDFYKQRNKDHG